MTETARDERLFPYFAGLETLDGVGPKTLPNLCALIGGERVLDLLFHLPYRFIDRSPAPDIASLQFEAVGTVCATVQAYEAPPTRTAPHKVRLTDETGFLTLVYFRVEGRYLQKQYPVGKRLVVSGKIDDFHGSRQIVHPDFVVPEDKASEIPAVEPVYRLTSGITSRKLSGWAVKALASVPDLPEWLADDTLERTNWPGFKEALATLHLPAAMDTGLLERAARRLAYDEALGRAVIFARRKQAWRSKIAPSITITAETRNRFTESLPFEPTGAQMRAMTDLDTDLGQPIPMHRLLQGDVGSGKTLIAAYAAALVAGSKAQTAVMAPTEVLASQLYESIRNTLDPLRIVTAKLTGSASQAHRTNVDDRLQSGGISVLVGTHALFQEKVTFQNLALAVIDEQHRFGVRDRSRLLSKGEAPHVLFMSATPIPRSLSLTVFGDLDLSLLDEKPKGRLPIITSALPATRMADVIEAVRRAIAKGDQIYWVCPLVDSYADGASAVQRREMLARELGVDVGLVHGRLPSDVKDAALEAFRGGLTRILVATTVIEVGVDVPAATIMVIERADAFGLSQLHQLRGRVGRSDSQSYCLAVYDQPLTDAGRERLEVFRNTDDGFEIAETDYRLRGAGDVLGVAQSGLPRFRLIDPARDAGLLRTASKEVGYLLERKAPEDGPRQAAMSLLIDLLSAVTTSPDLT